jgi:hypothetical protein
MPSSTALAHLFGWHWFSPRSASDDLLQKSMKIYDDIDLAADASVVFVGVNSGGTIAKSLALLKGRLGISFLSLPIDIDEFDDRYDLEANAAEWVSSVVNRDGLFSGGDIGFGENLALIGDPEIVGSDGVYESFCNLKLKFVDGVHSSGSIAKLRLVQRNWQGSGAILIVRRERPLPEKCTPEQKIMFPIERLYLGALVY